MSFLRGRTIIDPADQHTKVMATVPPPKPKPVAEAKPAAPAAHDPWTLTEQEIDGRRAEERRQASMARFARPNPVEEQRRAREATQEAERQRLLAEAASLHIAPKALPDLNAGENVRIPLRFLNGQGEVTFAVANGLLPPGIALSPDGLLHGEARFQGSWPAFDVVATDSSEPVRVASATYRLSAS